MKTITAILIDPVAKSLSTVKWDQELDSLYAFLRCKTVEAPTVLTLGDPVTVWMDEDYWQVAPRDYSANHAATMLPGCVPFAGRLLITGESDGDGGVLDCRIKVDELRDLIKFGLTTRPW